ncbi:MAG: hypothetical protein J0M08_09430 [Bacteroidetes bacterium]|nr:hypothetical protein [Bacteroidota bacterium]
MKVFFLNILLLFSFNILSLPPCFTSCGIGTNSQVRDGATFTTTTIAGSSSGWSNGSNSQTSNDSRATNTSSLASVGNYTDYLVITNFGFSLPATDNVHAIWVVIERRDPNAKVSDNSIKTVVSGSITGYERANTTTTWSTSDTYICYGGANDTWGNILTGADVNSSNFGVAISIKRNVSGGTAIGEIDHVYIEICYSPDPPPWLPVELLYFEGKQIDNNVAVNWATASEKNNSYFVLNKMTNTDFGFTQKATIQGSGNSQNLKSYEYIDTDLTSGTTYYSLDQVDYDGTIENIGITAIDIKLKEDPICLYSHESDAIILKLPKNETIKSVKILGIWGQEYIIIPNIKLQNDQLVLSYDVSKLPRALYTLVVETNNSVFYKKITK